MIYEVLKDPSTRADYWRVEASDELGKEQWVAVFSGLCAEKLAREYAEFKENK